MKKIITRTLLFIASFLLVFTLTYKNTYAKDLDLIEDYQVKVDTNFDNGTLDIRIDLRWHVLDSSTEGPLSWIKVGVPNYYADNIKGLSSNIKDISYLADNGSFIKIVLNQEYQAGSIIDISFSFNQSHMYNIDKNSNEIIYDYSPGFFNEIVCKNCTLKWNAKNVKGINNPEFKIVDGYYEYSHSLSYGETIGINLKYDRSVFSNIDPDATYTDRYDKFMALKVALFISLIVGIILISVLVNRLKSDPYRRNRGFYVPHSWHNFYRRPYIREYGNYGVSKDGKRINPPTSVGGGHAGGGCACACACAGGGRAGCSMKDYYHTNLKTNEVLKAMCEDEGSNL